MPTKSSFEERARTTFPSEIRWISTSCRDSQTPLTAPFGSSSSGLPDSTLPKEACGSCTFAFLQAASHGKSNSSYASWSRTMDYMNENLADDQHALLQSSRLLDINTTMTITPPTFTNGNVKRAVLIGINYHGKKDEVSELSNSHEHVLQMQEFLMEREGFAKEDITVLMDRKGHPYFPTRTNILTCFRRLAKQCKSGDVAFLHFSGHCGRIMDTTTRTKKGRQHYVKTLVPVDCEKSGPVLADDVYRELLCAIKAGVTLTCIMDCSCQHESVVRLPYVYTASVDDSGSQSMYNDSSFDFAALFGLAVIGGVLVTVGMSGDGGNANTADGGGDGVVGASSGGGGDGGASSGGEDDCCGGCCDGLLEGLFD